MLRDDRTDPGRRRSAVRELWPLPDCPHKGSRRTVPQPAGRPAPEAQIRQALRKIYADPTSNRPNVNKAYDLLKRSLPNARKASVMSVLDEAEFADQRRNPGNQPKR
jgi:hypothetical protein